MLAKKIYTLGYEGLHLNEYIRTLKENQIALVIDIREVAWSYKRGFSKTPLQTALQKEGIRYLHLKSAGNPSRYRKTAKTRKQGLSWYKKYLTWNQNCVDELMEEIKKTNILGQTVCITCYEKKPEDCHRSILLDFLLERQAKKAKIIHLHAA
jgi:uncharacterized protein (DUF488 family)